MSSQRVGDLAARSAGEAVLRAGPTQCAGSGPREGGPAAPHSGLTLEKRNVVYSYNAVLSQIKFPWRERAAVAATMWGQVCVALTGVLRRRGVYLLTRRPEAQKQAKPGPAAWSRGGLRGDTGEGHWECFLS